MGSKTRVKQWLLVTLLAAFGTYLAWSALRDRGLDRGFRALAEGASRDDVLALLGTPDARRPGCRDAPTWLNRPAVGAACAEEFEYRATLSTVLWTVGFDERGRAVAKYRYWWR